MQNMQMEIRYSPRFRKQYAKSNKKVKIAFNSRLELFLQNYHHPLLRNHSLRGGIFIFEVLGTHNQIYK